MILIVIINIRYGNLFPRSRENVVKLGWNGLLAGMTVSMMLMGCPQEPAPDGGTGGGNTGGGNTGGGGEVGGGGGGATGGGGGGDAGTTPRDLDVVVVRLNSNGTFDTTFGDAGIVRIDFGQTTGGGRDTVYGFDKDSAGRMVLFGSTKATGRSDTDRFVARLTTSGALDSSFATGGVHRLDVGNLNDNIRHGFVQADGKIVSSGYTAVPTGALLSDGGIQTANRPVLLRLDSAGVADATFGDGGVVSVARFANAVPTMPWGMAEAYGAARQSTGSYVTLGYGRTASSGPVDLVSFRYLETGADDPTWAGTGSFILNLVGGDERGRHVLALADDRIVSVGSGTPLTGNVDALVMVQTSAGAADTTFAADGYKTWSFGRSDEAFFGAAVGPGGMALGAVGYRTGSANTAAENDDAVLLVLPLSSGGPTEFAQAVPLSTGSHDRFFGVAWDGNKIIGAGFVREGADTKFAAARFNTNGSLDTTFGTGGIVTINVTEAGGTEEAARWVVVQADGKIVIAGPAEH